MPLMSVYFCFLENTEHKVIMPLSVLMHQNGGFPLQNKLHQNGQEDRQTPSEPCACIL